MTVQCALSGVFAATVVYRLEKPDAETRGEIGRRQHLLKATNSVEWENLLAEGGYYRPRVEGRNDTIFIDCGRKYLLGEIYLTAVDSAGQVNQDTLFDYRGLTASKSNIDELKDDIIGGLYRQGSYFASLNVEQAVLGRENLDLYLKIISGPAVTIERLRFKGLTRSDPRFIGNISGLHEGQPLIEEEVIGAAERIAELGYVRLDSLPQYIPNENYDGVEVVFPLTELPCHEVELSGGYLPRRGGQKGEMVGRLAFGSGNLFGSGQRIAAVFHKKDRASSYLRFEFAQPVFIPEHLDIAVRFEQTDYDSSYHAFTAGAAVGLRPSAGVRLDAHMSWSKTEPQRGTQSPSRAISGGFSYYRSSLRDNWNPSGGYRWKADITYIRRISWPDTTASAVVNHESSLAVLADTYWPVGRFSVVRLNLEGKTIITGRDLIDYSEKFKLGGFNSLRGYREEEFSGWRTFLGQAEMRYRPYDEAAFYLFTDYGYVYSRRPIPEGEIRTDEISRWGYGLGLFIGRRGAAATLAIGWGEGDSFGQGKLHIAIRTTF